MNETGTKHVAFYETSWDLMNNHADPLAVNILEYIYWLCRGEHWFAKVVHGFEVDRVSVADSLFAGIDICDMIQWMSDQR